MSKEVCNVLMVTARGIRRDGIASDATLRRAATAADYYEAHPSVDLIVVSGGYSRSMKTPPANNGREAPQMLAVLVGRGVPDRKIEIDEEAQSSFDHFINFANRFADRRFDAERPLGLVAGWAHYMRLEPIARRTLGLGRGAVPLINSPGESDPMNVAVEAAGALITRMAFIGAPGSAPEAARVAEERFEKWMGWARV